MTRLFVAILAALAASGAGAQSAAPAREPHVLVIGIDGVRPDVLAEVATPNIVPSTAKMSMAWPIGPWMRLPISGNRLERSVSGRPRRNAK